ncbi:MAG: AMP-binding protein [Telmatospirillum sp.]|nr:AMP-binding protein [Telmatospirillum sp.]
MQCAMQLMHMPIGHYFKNCVEKYPNNIAVIDSGDGSSLTWKELDQISDRYAKSFLSLGLRKSDRILLWMGNRIEWVIIFIAAVKIGVIPSGLNVQYEKDEIDYIIRSSGAKAVFFADGFRDNDHPSILKSIISETGKKEGESGRLPLFIHVGKSCCGSFLNFTSILSFENKFSGKLDEYTEINPLDTASILYTSGTTEHPKGVMLSHKSLVNNSYFTGIGLKLSAKDRLCLAVPFSHCFGISAGLLTCIGAGTTAVLVGLFKPKDVLEAVRKYRCTALHGVPTMFQRLLEHPDFPQSDLSSLRTGIVAGAACPSKVLEGIVNRLGMSELVVAYGQTETSPGCTQTDPDDSLAVKASTVGRPLPFVEMRVVDPETGLECPPGVKGELCTRGYHVMRGYVGQPDQTAAVIDAGGWFHSGDCGFVDEDGRFHFESRLKEIIVRGGENISPAEIEKAIMSIDAVRDVRVYGVPVDVYGEEIAASICLKPGYHLDKDELQKYLKGKISWCKIPKFVEFCDNFEVLSSGKVRVSALRHRMEQTIAGLCAAAGTEKAAGVGGSINK